MKFVTIPDTIRQLMPKITVDGKSIEAKQGQMILQACNDVGHVIPQYCYHPGMSIPASCRICLVEVEGIPKLVPSCQTPIRDGMVVHSQSSKAIANQKQVMEYLLINHPLDCPVCDQAGECSLQDYSYQYGRSQSRFEEDKAKKPKKDVGESIYLYSDRCIMCTRCVRFTREVSGTSELFVEGRGHKEEIAIFPGKPCNNKLSLNVVDLCPVGALLDKDFLFKQRVWLLKEAASISPVDSGGENIWLHHNEGVVYRIKPRYNAEVNTWWISDDTRHSYKAIHSDKRLHGAKKKRAGVQEKSTFAAAIESAGAELRRIVEEYRSGSLYALLSPMMACEEAWLLAKAIRAIDPEALLILGPVPSAGEDEIFKNPANGRQTFVIKGEKVPNAAGIRRVMEMLGGPTAEFDAVKNLSGPQAGKLRAGWIVGGYLSSWIGTQAPDLFVKSGHFRVVQDIFPSMLTEYADVLLPAAAWAEKDGCWENYQNKIQVFSAAIPVPDGVMREGDVYRKLTGETSKYDAESIRQEMGEAFAAAPIPASTANDPVFDFVEI